MPPSSSQIQGRWRLFLDRKGQPTGVKGHMLLGTAYSVIPVVPCDDAAVRRVARSMAGSPPDLDAEPPSSYLDAAKRALRAAGEQS